MLPAPSPIAKSTYPNNGFPDKCLQSRVFGKLPAAA